LQNLHWREQGKAKGHVKDGETRLKRIKCKGNNNRQVRARDLREWRKIVLESQGPQWTVTFEEEEEEEEEAGGGGGEEGEE
jgi:hypothetical protein